jgi:uncharacterized membrane protein
MVTNHKSISGRRNIRGCSHDSNTGFVMLRERIEQIDALRGTAMLFVLMAHCLAVVFRYDYNYSNIVSLLEKIFMIASPSFILISGIVMGLRFKLRETDFFNLRSHMIDRGLYLLTIVHLLIGITHYFYFGGLAGATNWVMITDAVGVGVIAAAILLPKLRLMGRVVLACILFGISWSLMGVHLQNRGIEILKETVFGSTDNRHLIYGFYIAPWVSFFFIGTCFGERIGSLLALKKDKQLQSFLLRAGLIFILSAVFVKTIYLFAKFYGFAPVENHLLYMLSTPFQKYPPGPVYFIFFSGFTLLMLYSLFIWQKNVVIKGYSRFISVLGRNSLFVFVLQFFVYYILLNYVRTYVHHWLLFPVSLCVSVWIIYIIARSFEGHNLSRILTFKGLYKAVVKL